MPLENEIFRVDFLPLSFYIEWDIRPQRFRTTDAFEL